MNAFLYRYRIGCILLVVAYRWHYRVDLPDYIMLCHLCPPWTKYHSRFRAHDRCAPAEQTRSSISMTLYALDITPQARILLSVYPENRV